MDEAGEIFVGVVRTPTKWGGEGQHGRFVGPEHAARSWRCDGM